MKLPMLVVSLAMLVGGLVGWFLVSLGMVGTIEHIQAQTQTDKSLSELENSFSIELRELWEDHVTWTRLYFVDYASENGFAEADEDRLLKNQKEIGEAFIPYFGHNTSTDLSNALTAYVKSEIRFIQALKSDDKGEISQSLADWNSNGNQVAELLAGVNSFWSKDELQAVFRNMMELTKAQAINITDKEYTASVKDFDRINSEAMHLADILAAGIISSYPGKF